MKKIYSLLAGLLVLPFSGQAVYLTGTPQFTPGEGTASSWVRSNMSYINLGGTIVSTDADFGGAVTFVINEENTLWMNFPLSGFVVDSWVEGKIAGDVATFDLPQALFDEEGQTYFLAMLDLDSDQYLYSQQQTFTMKRQGNNWISDNRDENRVVGIVAYDGSFMGCGSYDIEYVPFEEPEEVLPPAELEASSYAFINNGAGHFINIAIGQDEVFFQGLVDSSPDTWIRGDRDGEDVTIPAMQYLGIWEKDGFTPHYSYLLPAYDYNGNDMPEDELLMKYDEETGVFSSTGRYLVNFSDEMEMISYITSVDKPTFTPQSNEEKAMVPANPVSVTLFKGAESVICNIPQTSIDGELLDIDNLYYRMYVDGELFTFNRDEYQYLDVEEMTDVPFNYSEQYDFFVQGSYHEIYFYFTGADVIGFQSVYDAGGEKLVSDIVNSDGSVIKVGSGVSEIAEGLDVVSTEYYDLSGRKVSSETPGLKLKRLHLSDGSRKTVKILK